MISHRAFALLLASVLPAVAVAGQAPSGYRKYANKLSGLTFYYPPAYKQIPLPPTETVLRARYVRKGAPAEFKRAKLRTSFKPEIYVFMFRAVTPTTGTAKKPQASGPSNARESIERRLRVTSFSEFKQKRLRGLAVKDAKKDGHYDLEPGGNSVASRIMRRRRGTASRRGYMVVKEDGVHVLGVYGLTLTPHLKRLRSEITKMSWALGLSRARTTEIAESNLDRKYGRSKLRAVEKRKEVRRRLAKGWKAIDTPNYVVVHHSKNATLVNRIARNIEAMRAVYERLFPPAKPIDAVSIVRVCRTLEEYHQYGGPPGSGGYWHSGNEELVFFDYSQTMRQMDSKQKRRIGRKLTDKDSLLVLYHEAFHQYIYYAVGAFSPHDWFNEGYGDYFSGAIIASSSKKVSRIGPSPWRIHRAKDQCEHGEGFVPLKRLLHAQRPEFYNPRRRSDYYAAAWSFLYFLHDAKAVRKNPKWAGFLKRYFHALKNGYANELAGTDKPTMVEKQKASFGARKKAIAAALEGVDLAELEQAWRHYVTKMHDPWKSKRKKARRSRRR